MKKIQLPFIVNEYLFNFDFNTLANSSISLTISFIFAIYNAYIGLRHFSLWNSSICIYYFLLGAIRLTIVNAKVYSVRRSINCKAIESKIFIITSHLLFLLNVSLFVPMTVMAKGERDYNFSIVPPIAMALYAIYRIATVIINLRKTKTYTNSVLVHELRIINLIDALVATVSIQNALIMTLGLYNGDTRLLFALLTDVVLIMILVICSLNLWFGRQYIDD